MAITQNMILDSDKLQALRKKKGLTIKELSIICDYSHSHMWKMVNGEKPVTKQVEWALRLGGYIK